jgi:hypothetical protein
MKTRNYPFCCAVPFKRILVQLVLITKKFVYRGYFWAQFKCDWGRHCERGDEEDENLPVLPSVHNASGPRQPKVQLFNSASLSTQCSWPWATQVQLFQQCFPLYTMFLALGNPRYSFLTVLHSVNYTIGSV